MKKKLAKNNTKIDTGQRYKIMCRNGLGQESPYGYTDTLDSAAAMERSLRFDPDRRVPRIIDRHDPKLCRYQPSTYACPKGATKKYDADLDAEVTIPCEECGATLVFSPQQKIDKKGRIVKIV